MQGGRRRTIVSLALLCLFPALAYAQTTGWNQTAAGTYDYNLNTNWVGSSINGIWDSSLTLAAGQTITFAADTALTTGLTFNYVGNVDEIFRATGGDRTLTLGGDIAVNTVNVRSNQIVIGSATATQRLHVDLGGTARNVKIAGVPGTQRGMTFTNNVSNGALTLTGGGIVNMNSVNTLTALTLKGGMFAHSSAAGDTAITNALTIDGAAGGAGFITLSSGASTHPSITANSLTRANGGVVFFRGATLGTAAPATNNVNNITFTNSLESGLVGGGGAAGTQNISILPWASGDTSVTGVGSTTTTLATYDATNGIRLLTASEFDSTITDGASTSNNVQLPNGSTTTINSSTTINSLVTASGATATTLNGSGTLTITSGAVFLGTGNGLPNLTTTLNFGAAQGVIGTGAGKGGTFGSAVQGSGGLVLYQSAASTTSISAGVGLTYNGNAASSTYTGNTYILGRAAVSVNNFLPNFSNGSRTGDVYVNGELDANNSLGINGLNGNGLLTRTVSGSGTITIGDNNASGIFAGVIANNGGTLGLTKIGSGTQILSGVNTYGGSTIVNNGTLSVTGSLASGTVTVSSIATLKGTGTVAGNINAAGTVAPGNSVGTLTTGSANLTGTLAIEVDGAAGDKLLSSGAIDVTAATLTVTPLSGGFTQPSYIIAEGTSITGPFASVPAGYAVNIVSGGVGQQAVLTSTSAGGYTSWASTNAGGQAADLDFDNDGTSNGVEYFMNAAAGFTSNPGVVAGAVTWPNGGNIASSAYGTQFVVQTSSNLLNWIDVPSGSLSTNTSGPGGSLTYTLPTGQGKLFVRLSVNPQ